MESVGTKVLILHCALQRIGNGEWPMRLRYLDLRLSVGQWRNAVCYRIVSMARMCGGVRVRTVDPPATKFHWIELAQGQMRIPVQEGMLEEIELHVQRWCSDAAARGVMVQRKAECVTPGRELGMRPG